MNTESNRQNSFRRSNDEFLRRMRGGEFCEEQRTRQKSEIPVLATLDIPGANNRQSPSCDGRMSQEPETGREDYGNCRYPSLAMVYSPKQKWREVMSPEDGLRHGTIFRELVKPWEAGERGRGGIPQTGCGRR